MWCIFTVYREWQGVQRVYSLYDTRLSAVVDSSFVWENWLKHIFMMIHMHCLSFPITGMVHVDILSRGWQHFIETVLSIHTGRACSFQRFANNHTPAMLFNFFETHVYHYPEIIMQLTDAFVSVYTFSVVIGVVWYAVLAYFVIIFTMGM